MASTYKNNKQVMDVSKPGKTAPTASAKPVIVGHGPMVQDPMVTPEASPEAELATPEQATPEVSSPAAGKKVITPLTESDKVTETSVDEPVAEVAEVPQEEPKLEEPEQVTEETTESAVVDAVIDQVGSKKKEDIVSEEDRKKQEHIDTLIEEKKYFVPIGKTHGKSGGVILIITLLLLLVLIGLLAAIDAELIDAGFTLPFDLL